MPTWQKRRTEFNHDWLRNSYIQSLGNWQRLLEDEVTNEGLEARFVAEVLPQWEEHRQEGGALLDDFEREMSPRTLFASPPLSRCDAGTSGWLAELVHALWLSRRSLRERLAAARRCMAEAERAYAELTQRIDRCEDTRSVASLRACRDEFQEFGARCEALTQAIGKLPLRVEVT